MDERRVVWMPDGIIAVQVGKIAPGSPSDYRMTPPEYPAWLTVEHSGWLMTGPWTVEGDLRTAVAIRAEHTHWLAIDQDQCRGLLMTRGACPLHDLDGLMHNRGSVWLREVPDVREWGDRWGERVVELLTAAGWVVCPGEMTGEGSRVAIPVRRA